MKPYEPPKSTLDLEATDSSTNETEEFINSEKTSQNSYALAGSYF